MSASAPVPGVPEVLTHEESQAARIEAARAKVAAREAALQQKHAETLRQTEADLRRDVEQAVQAFAAAEAPTILANGHAAADDELSRLRARAKKHMPALAESLAAQLASGDYTRS